ncbi:hypothetical protein ACJRO7_010378 [Eucalyptus globulus]|uniref:Uncharacterized protein n=1 Tax=Eucalyptus globulus TaxID=34317 RepID=A0ABD3LLU0_EUCGL
MGKEYEHVETIVDDLKTPKSTMARRPPHNFVAILKDADELIDPFSKEVCEQLYNGVLLNNKKKKYWVDEESNKNCFMVLAKDLTIVWGENTEFWKWNTIQETSDLEIEVAVLQKVCWLEVRGKFRTISLAPMTKYEIAFVVKITDSHYNWDDPVKFTVTLPNGKKEECFKSLRRVPQEGWKHIPVCKFVMSPENVGEVTFALDEHVLKWKSGLVIKGVSFQPVRDT